MHVSSFPFANANASCNGELGLHTVGLGISLISLNQDVAVLLVTAGRTESNVAALLLGPCDWQSQREAHRNVVVRRPARHVGRSIRWATPLDRRAASRERCRAPPPGHVSALQPGAAHPELVCLSFVSWALCHILSRSTQSEVR